MSRKKAANGQALCECPVPRSRADATDERRRNPDLCGNPGCLGYIDPAWTSNDDTFRTFYGRLSDALPHETGLDDFISQAQERERAGREKFGLAFLGRDNPIEGTEEFADGSNYIFFKQLQILRENEDNIPWDLLLETARHAFLAWRGCQLLRHHRTEYLGHIDTEPNTGGEKEADE